jgi:hypothetical protein
MSFKSVTEHFKFLTSVKNASIKSYKSKRKPRKFSIWKESSKNEFVKILLAILVVWTRDDVAGLLKYLSDHYAPNIDLSGIFLSSSLWVPPIRNSC